jgi:hypothetical protein
MLLLLFVPLGLTAQMVVINEIAWMGTSASASDEWIELCNFTSSPVDLQGWTLVSADGTPAIHLAGIIPANGFFVLERTDDQTISDRPADQLFTGDLKNSGEWLVLRSADSLLIDQVRCDSLGWFAGSNAPKRSMEKRHPLLNGMLPLSWAANDSLTQNGHDANGNPVAGTPGSINSVFDHTLPVDTGLRPAPAGESAVVAAYPNPFNPGTMLVWHPSGDDSVIEIFDLLGRTVRSWPSGLATQKRGQLFWDGCDASGRPVPAGIYLCCLRRSNRIAALVCLLRCR